jgi:D-beta-D-heptose 7-phosphate kinase/D-beta-D-heptose 1-phosphate adenosyltransferase
MSTGDADVIRDTIRKFEGLSVGLLGDVTADVFTFTRPKASPRPVAAPILTQENAEVRPGRAGNVAVAMAALGADVRLVAVVGEDGPGELLLGALEKSGVAIADVISSSDYLTPTRTLIFSGPPDRAKRLVARVDQETMAGLPSGLSGKVLSKVRAVAPDVSGWLLSDHGFGIAAPGVASMVEGVRVAESKGRVEDFQGMTALVVSSTEAERSTGRPVEEEGQARRAAGEILDTTGAGHLLLTRGSSGMMLFAEDGREGQLPPVTHLEAADADGEGDAAVAAFTLALAAGAAVEDAATISNLVAGFKVGRPGTVPVSADEVIAVLGG